MGERSVVEGDIYRVLREMLYLPEVIEILEERLDLKGIRRQIERVMEYKEAISYEVKDKVSREELARAIQSIKELILVLRDEINKRLDQMDKRFDQMDKRFEELLHYVDKRFEELLHYIDKRFEELLHYVDKRFEDMDKKFNVLVRLYNRIFWLIVSLITPLILTMIGIGLKLLFFMRV
jgi:PAS domain-containing protein